MSVQASSTAYCTPKVNGAHKYTEVEVGFPSDAESLLINYAENPDQLTNTVYGYVPAQVVINVIAKHGGIVYGELPPGLPMLMV
jgi:hypothetical protein